MRIHHVFLLAAAVAMAACSYDDPGPTLEPPEEPSATVTTAGPPEPTTTTTGPPEPATTTTTEPPEPTTTSTGPPEGGLEWPANPPSQYAVVDGGQLVVIQDGERREADSLPDEPAAGGFVDDVIYFSLGCCGGIWQWEYSHDGEVVPVVGEQSDEQTTLHGVVDSGQQAGFFFSEGGDRAGDTADLMFYDLATGDTQEFFSAAERRPNLSEEEQTAAVGKVVATDELVGVLFAFGDSTWIEWYTHTGESAESPFGDIGETETVLDLALTPEGSMLAVGIEEELNQGIATVHVVGTDGSGDVYSLPEGQSLRDLRFDGRYVTASLHETDEATPGQTTPAGTVILDIERSDFSYFDGPHILALAGVR